MLSFSIARASRHAVLPRQTLCCLLQATTIKATCAAVTSAPGELLMSTSQAEAGLLP